MFSYYILGILLYKLILFFVIYSFLGWISEVSYAFYNRRIFINRGFLFGPVCPIYGLGLVVVIILTNNIKDNLLLLFTFSTLITSLLEYTTGFILEKLFHSKWWDYTEDPFNLHGRICLHFSIMWGLATTIIVKVIHPIINFLIDAIPFEVIKYILSLFIVTLLLDFSFTLKSLIKFKPILTEILKIRNELKRKYTYIFSSTKIKTLERIEITELNLKEIMNRYNTYYSNLSFNHRRLLKSFSNISIFKIENLAKQIRKKLLQLKENMKEEVVQIKEDLSNSNKE
jgi:uncharacterized membrane protein